jgi:hypothetical protein
VFKTQDDFVADADDDDDVDEQEDEEEEGRKRNVPSYLKSREFRPILHAVKLIML